MSDLNMELQESGWEELRKEARKIEGDLDVKLSSYAKLGARFTQDGELLDIFVRDGAQTASGNMFQLRH
ncbi:Golgi SNAP receptor complex member 1-2 [Bienertia sinuspersici]